MIIPLILTTTAALATPASLSLDAQVSRLWNSLSNAPQTKPDIASLQQLFVSNATISGVRHKNGEPSLNLQQASEFIAGQDPVKPYGFYECEIVREVRVTGSFATVLSLVWSSRVVIKHNYKLILPELIACNGQKLIKAGNLFHCIITFLPITKPTPC